MKFLFLSLLTIFAFTHCGDKDEPGANAGNEEIKPETRSHIQQETETTTPALSEDVVQNHCVDGSYEISADFVWDAWSWNAWKKNRYNISIASSDTTIFVLLKQKVDEEGETAQVTCSEFDRKDEKTLQARVLKKAKTNDENFTNGISDLKIIKDLKKADTCHLTLVRAANPNNNTDKGIVSKETVTVYKKLDTTMDYQTLKKECDALDPVVF